MKPPKGRVIFWDMQIPYARMHSDFLYPDVSCRLAPEAWHQAGALDIQARARIKGCRDFIQPTTTAYSKEIEAALRQKYGIAEFEK